MTGAARIAALAGGSALAVFAAMRWLGGDGGAPDDVGRVAIRDVLIERDAELHEGRLEGCNASSCELDGRHFERSTLAFVGLGVENATPPPVEDPSQDELGLRGGGVVHEPLAQIDDEAVFAGARRFERNEVAWVALAAEAEPPGSQGGTEPESEPESQEPPPPPPPPPPPTDPGPRPPVRRPRPPNDLVKPCPPDRPLGGSLELELVYTREQFYRCDQQARLWFGLVSMNQTQKWPAPLGSPHHSDAITYRLTSSGCSDMPDPHGEVCSAPGETRSGRLDFGPVGPLGVANQSGGVTFYPTDPKLSFELLDEIHDWRVFQIQCVAQGGGTSGGHGIEIGGQVEPWGPDDCEIGPCVAPTACYHAEGALRADCYEHPDRYAVIPFEGSATRRLLPGTAGLNSGEFYDMSTRWRVCCGCGQPPHGPPPDFAPRPPGDCEDADATLAGLIGRLRALAEAFRTHQHAFRCAEAGREEARDRIWGLDGSWTAYFYSLPWVATTGGRAPAGGRAEFLDNARRIVGDLVDYAHAVRDGRMNVEGAVQWLVDMAGTTQAWRNAEDPLRGEYAQALAAARRLAQQYLNRNPGDWKGAAQIFDEDFAARAARISPRRGLNALGALRNLSAWSGVWTASTRLVHDVSLYADWKAEEERAKRDMESAQDAMRDVQAEIDALRARCPDLPPGSGVPLPEPPPNVCPDVPPGSEHLRSRALDPDFVDATWSPGATDVFGRTAPGFGSPFVPAALPATRVAAAAAQGGGSPESAQAREAAQRLDAAVQRMGTRMADAIAPRLAPFLLNATGDLEPAFAAVLLEKAGAELQALMPDLEQAAAAAEEIQRIVEAARPPEAAGSR